MESLKQYAMAIHISYSRIRQNRFSKLILDQEFPISSEKDRLILVVAPGWLAVGSLIMLSRPLLPHLLMV